MDARYADGRAAITTPASFEIGAHALSIETSGGRFTWAYSELRRADDGNGEIMLKRAPDTGERLIIADGAAASALRAAAPALFTPRALGVESPALVGGLTGAAVSLAAAFLIGVPLAAEPLARVMPAQYQQQIGTIARAQVEGMSDVCEGSEQANNLLTDLAFRFLHASHSPNLALRDSLEVTIVSAPFPNAFALPDNSVIITDQLIAAAEHPDEIAGVLAHEVAHIDHHHVMANVIRNVGAGVFFDIVFGGAGLGQAAAIASVNLAALRYSRGDETEADDAALDYLDAAGIDPGALAQFFDRMADLTGEPTQGDIPTLLSTHPATAERAAAARARARPGQAPSLSADEWRTIRSACGGNPGDIPGKPGPPPPVNKTGKPL